MPKIAVAYTQIVTISRTSTTHCREPVCGRAVTFLPIPRTIQQDSISRSTIDPENNPMIPHTLVLKPTPSQHLQRLLVLGSPIRL